MNDGGSIFSQILAASRRCWRQRTADEFVLSMAMPLKDVDPLSQLPLLIQNQQFSFLWDRKPSICFAAAGQCQHLDLVGSQRFDVAQRFCDETFDQLIDATPEAPIHSFPKILLAFSFFEKITQRDAALGEQPAVQAVLPRWQLSNQKSETWLRLNGVINNESDAREIAEQLWLMNEKLTKALSQEEIIDNSSIDQLSIISTSQSSQDCYKSALSKGIELVNSGELNKLVLAVKQPIVLNKTLDPVLILSRLRYQQASSCRFLWQTNKYEAFFGASPERLLSFKGQNIRVDALAGTANKDEDGEDLLRSDKNLREHDLVVSAIINQLVAQGLEPTFNKRPQIAKQGHLLHLHTSISAVARNQLPMSLIEGLHPTPAVSGHPQRKALNWLRALEPFDRGGYAAPIGWIDNCGNAEFRVAIRCGYTKGNKLDLIAGAGLVRGSTIEGELEEVNLKLAILADQLTLGQFNSQSKVFNRRSIT